MFGIECRCPRFNVYPTLRTADMLTLLRIAEQLLDSDQSAASKCSGTVLSNGDHMSMMSNNNHGSLSNDNSGDAHNYPQHSNHHRHHHPHLGCSACLDKKPIFSRSMKTVSFDASSDEKLVDSTDGTRRSDVGSSCVGGDNRRLENESTEAGTRAPVRAKCEPGKLRSWISVVGDINELSSEPERGISGIPHKDQHGHPNQHRQSPAASARKRHRERNRSIPTDGQPAMTDLGTPLAKPRRNSDGATIIRRFLVTPVEDSQEEDSFAADMKLPAPPLPRTPPPSEPTSLVFVPECPVDITPCARPSILKKTSSSPESAPKSPLRCGTFTMHTEGLEEDGSHDAGSESTAAETVIEPETAKEQSNNDTGCKVDIRINVVDVDKHELVRGPENRLPTTTLKSDGISDTKVVTVDEWLGDRGVDFDPVESPTRTRLRRSISAASGIRQKKVSFDLEHVDVFLLDQELISDEQGAYLNERFRQFLGDSVVRANNQGSLQQQEAESTTTATAAMTSLVPPPPGRDASAATDSAIVADDGGDDNGIELVKKTLTDDDKTWLKT